jgi:hypothetical protein
MEIPKEHVFARESAGQVLVAFKENNFFVNDKELQRSDLDDTLRKVRKPEELKALLQHRYIAVNKANNGEFSIASEGKLDGGGPILAWGVWGIIKAGTFLIPVIAKKSAKKKNKHHHREDQAWQAMDLASDSIKTLDDNWAGPVISKGTSFIYDEAEKKGYIYVGKGSSTGDDSGMATLMLIGTENIEHAKKMSGDIADRIRDALMVVPGP